MAKIDVTKIEGYAEMSPEEKLRVLEAYDVPETDLSDLRNKYDALLRENKVTKFKAKLLTLGYDEKLADETAEAIADGDTEKLFTNHKKHLDAFEKKLRSEILMETPKPVGDSSSHTMTLKELRGLSPAERLAFAKNNPEEYKQLYSGGNE